MNSNGKLIGILEDTATNLDLAVRTICKQPIVCAAGHEHNVESHQIDAYLVQDVQSYTESVNQLRQNRPAVLIADLKLIDGETTKREYEMIAAAKEIAGSEQIDLAGISPPHIPGWVFINLFVNLAPSDACVVVASNYSSTAVDYLRRLATRNWIATGFLADPGIYQTINKFLQRKFCPLRLEDLLDKLAGSFAACDSRPFPHGIGDRPETRGEFRAWAEQNFPALDVEGEALDHAYEAAKGLLGGGHGVRLGTLALLVLFLLNEADPDPRARPKVTIDRDHGYHHELSGAAKWAEDNNTHRRGVLLQFYGLFKELTRDVGCRIDAIVLGDRALRLVVSGYPSIKEIRKTYIDLTTGLGNWYVGAVWSPAKSPETWLREKFAGGQLLEGDATEAFPADAFKSIIHYRKSQNNVTSAFIAAQLLSGFRVHFRASPQEPPIPGAINLSSDGQSLELVITP